MGRIGRTLLLLVVFTIAAFLVLQALGFRPLLLIANLGRKIECETERDRISTKRLACQIEGWYD